MTISSSSALDDALMLMLLDAVSIPASDTEAERSWVPLSVGATPACAVPDDASGEDAPGVFTSGAAAIACADGFSRDIFAKDALSASSTSRLTGTEISFSVFSISSRVSTDSLVTSAAVSPAVGIGGSTINEYRGKHRAIVSTVQRWERQAVPELTFDLQFPRLEHTLVV